MGGKKGGGQRTPRIDKNTLNSFQKLKKIDLVSSGLISGWMNGDALKSIYINDTVLQNKDGTLNHSGIRLEYLAGHNDQDYLANFSSSENTVTVSAQVKRNIPITRTVVNPQVTSVRVTVGVDALSRNTNEGDQLATSVDMSIQIIKNTQVYASKHMHLNEKGSKPFRLDFVFDDLPPAPFDIKCIRLTEDSNDDMLRNSTFFFSYVESIDAKFRYPKCAIVGIEVDSEQFGSANPVVTYGVKGCVIKVPSNYDPETRTYSGMWDRLFKPAYSNNPAWVLYDILTDEVDGFGARFKNYSIDIDKLYELSKYCDEMIDDGNGGKEPRFVCNAAVFGNSARTVLFDICSIFRGLPSFANDRFTVYYDRKSDVSAVYNNSNVVDGVFEYARSPRTDQFNQYQIQYVDQDDGYRTKIHEVSNEKHIQKNGLNSQSIVAYGVTKMSYAVRYGLGMLITSLTEIEYVSFKIGAQGLRHELYDIISVADNDYAGVQIGGRIISASGKKVVLDRVVESPLSITVNNGGYVRIYDVESSDGETLVLKDVIDAKPFTPFVATLKSIKPRLFRCVSIIEEDGGIYSVTCVQHNDQKEKMIDAGAEYIEPQYTSINPLPQISNGIASNEGRFILLEWDSLTTIGKISRYEIRLFKGNEVYKEYMTVDPRLELYDLPMGDYSARIRAFSEEGRYGNEIVIPFSTTYIINGLTASNNVIFGIKINWENPPLITSNAKIEVWTSSKEDSGFERSASLAYPTDNYGIGNLSVGQYVYFKVRIVDENMDAGEFAGPVRGMASTDSESILSYLKGQITATELGDDVVNGIIKDVLNDDEFDQKVSSLIDDELTDLDDKVKKIIKESDIIYEINSRIGSAESELQILSLSSVTSDSALSAQSLLINAKTDENAAQIQLVNMAESSSTHAQAAQIALMKAETDTSVAEIKNEQKVFASEFESQSQAIEKLNSSVGENSSELVALKKSTSDQFGAQAKDINSLNVKTGENTSQLQILGLAESSSNEANAAQMSLIKAEFDTNTAAIRSEQRVQADQLSTQAQTISKISANVGENNASISESKKAIATIDGKVEATYSLTANTNGVITGFKFGSDGKQGVFNIMANSFVISNQVDGKVVTPFVLWGNKLALDGDMIATGSLSGDKLIANTSITAPIIKGGRIESGHIAGGSINIGNGNFNVDANGNLYAKSGRFEGVVYAEKIEGDIATFYSIEGHAVKIPPAKFDRLVVFFATSIKGGVFTDGPRPYAAKGYLKIIVNGTSMQTSYADYIVVSSAKAVTVAGSIFTSNDYYHTPISTEVNFSMKVKANESPVISLEFGNNASLVNGKFHIMSSRLREI